MEPAVSGPRGGMARGVPMSTGGVTSIPRNRGHTGPPSSTLRARAADPADLPPRRLPGWGSGDPAVTAVRPRVRRASPPPPRSRGGVAEPPPTCVVDVQLVRDALVAPAEDDHQLPDGHGSVSVPGAGHRPGEGGNPPPVEEAGSRHLPNPRPSAHNAPRATGSTARGEDERRLQLCAGGPARDPRAPPPGPWRRGPRGSAKIEPLPTLLSGFPWGVRGGGTATSFKSTWSIFRVGESHPGNSYHRPWRKAAK